MSLHQVGSLVHTPLWDMGMAFWIKCSGRMVPFPYVTHISYITPNNIKFTCRIVLPHEVHGLLRPESTVFFGSGNVFCALNHIFSTWKDLVIYHGRKKEAGFLLCFVSHLTKQKKMKHVWRKLLREKKASGRGCWALQWGHGFHQLQFIDTMKTVWHRIQILLHLALDRAFRLYVTSSLQLVGAKVLGLVLQGARVNYSTESKFRKASGDRSLFSVVILKQSEAPV